MITIETIGRRIKYCRKKLAKLSQSELSEKLKVDRSFVSRIESGTQNITVETLIKICECLDISLKEFFNF